MLEQQLDQQQTQPMQSPIDEEFNNECLRAHNEYRQLHDCPPLKLSARLAAGAQIWADHLASVGYLTHSPNAAGNFGENVALKMALGSRDYTGNQATAQWYSEIEMYNFEGVENQARCGHFSQVVWKATQKAGFGKAVSPDGKMFAVGQYTPPGNMMDAWVVNVPRPISGQIKIPSYQEIMGVDEQKSAAKVISSTWSLVEDPETNPAAALLLSAAQQLGDIARLEPRPREPLDRQIGKSTKTRVLNGDRSLILTVTFMRPDGSRYHLTNQVPLPDPDPTPQLPSNGNNNRISGLLIDPTGAGSDKDRADDDGDFSPRRFADEMLAAHNELRVRYQAPRLARSESLECLAQSWANRLADEGQLRHCDVEEAQDLGQSLASLPAERRLGEEMKRLSAELNLGPAALLAKQWYGESAGFKPGDGDEEETGRCINGGHFTQMVWRSTEKLGVGCTIDKTTGDAYAVCFYSPSGNVAGEFGDNVLSG